MKTLQLIMFVSLMLFPRLASAGLSDVRYTPDPAETQQSLSKITIQFMDANYGISGHVDTSGITLSKKGGTDVLYALADPATDYAKLFLEFAYKGATEPYTITEDGIYTLHIPAGAVTSMGASPQTNDEINVDFTVSSTVETPMSKYTLTPEAGEVEKITTITLSFPKSGGLDWFHNNLYGSNNLSAITLSKEGSDITYKASKKSYDGVLTVTLAFVDAGNNEVEITEPGKYLLDIPAGMFQKDFTQITNEHITAEYTIPAPMPAEFAGMISTPAYGSTVGQLKTLSMTFPAMSAGLEYPVPNVSRITVKAPDGTVYYAFNPVVKGNEGVYDTVEVSFAPTQNAYNVSEAVTLTQAGEYEITVGAEALKVYGNDVTNSEFKIKFTVDPQYNFTYTISPDPQTIHGDFGLISIGCGESIRSIAVKDGTGLQAEISLGQTVYHLLADATQSNTVTFTVPENAEPTIGEWTLNIPAGFFEAVNHDGLTITNREAITSPYIIQEAERFPYTVTPAEGSTVEFFKNIIVSFSGDNFKSVMVNMDAGIPTISGNSRTYNLTATVAVKDVTLAINGGAGLADGAYTISIPAGYLVTVDKNNLSVPVEAISLSLNVKNVAGTDYTQGILFLNEGWFGHDSGSLNFLSNTGEWTYDVFLRHNPGHSLGLTSQYGQCFGDNIYIVSKDAADFNGIDAAQFVVIDAATMQFKGQIYQMPDTKAKPRAFCAWDEHKGYISTDRQIYCVDLDKMEITGEVPCLDQYPSFNSNGEMLRYGDFVFAVRQSTGIDVINTVTDGLYATIPAELTEALVVLPDGDMIAASRNESNEFIRILPSGSFPIREFYDIDVDKAKITSVWNTWRKAPIAASTSVNEVYYVTQAETEANPNGARNVARYNFDTETFTPYFITLPGKSDGEDADWVLYGEGVSVDPATGRILLTAVEAGYGDHYMQNRIFVADPVTGTIDNDASYTLEPNFWFPAMTLYPDFDAPVIDASTISLLYGPVEFTIDLASCTTLRSGNPHLINYDIQSLAPQICEVMKTSEAGIFTVKVKSTDAYSLQLAAEFQGKTTTQTISTASSIDAIEAEAEVFDIYNTLGICILRNATEADLAKLPSGIYVANGRKIYIR